MRTHRAPARLVPSLLLVTWTALSCSSGDPPALTGSESLRESFPDQAPRVLDGGEAFAPSIAGFSRVRRGGFAIELPREGGDAIVLRAARGGAVAVREAGLAGPGAIAGSAVAYRRAGGTSFWTAVPFGVEEWLHLDAGVARRGAAVAAWDLEGASARARDGAVDGVDGVDGVDVIGDDGAARMVVTAPAAYAAGGRPVAAHLEARGARIELFVDADGEAVLVDPQWTLTGPMANGRTAHVAALLASGQVLVTGGEVSKVAELYDPVAGTFSPTGSMAFARLDAAAATLVDGQVLVTGGELLNSAPVACELYDPVAGTFGPTTGPMLEARINHTATLLPNGKVLVAGGFTPFSVNSALASAELYDPATGMFAVTGSMLVPRGWHTATLLANGMVLVAGGSTPGAAALMATADAEIYDPGMGTFAVTGAMTLARTRHGAAALESGEILVSGGTDASSFASAEIFDPASGMWTATGDMAYPRYAHTATLLGSGKVLAVGGLGNPPPQAPGLISEVFDPAVGTWSFGGSLSTNHSQATATLLGDGSLLIAGGSTAVSELYSPESPAGTPCSVGGECESTFCVDGVCCLTVCDGAPCEACSVAKGALMDGTCYPLSGTPCDDGNACTQGDMCMAGACASGNPVLCPVANDCYTLGVCDPATGVCSTPKKPEGTSCDDGDACTVGDTCSSGMCVSGPAVVCVAPDQCHLAGTCNPATGVCEPPKKVDGSPCDDGDACTQSDTCQAGVCVGAKPIECPPGAPCEPNTCDPLSGACNAHTAMNGAPCDDGDPCTQAGACMAGACVPGAPITCPADACHAAGTCAPATGKCDNAAFPDGASCPGGTCVAGICTPRDGGAGDASAATSTGSGSGGGGGAGGGDVGQKSGCAFAASSTGGEGRWAALALLVAAAHRRRRALTRVG